METLNARLEETQNGWAMATQQAQKLEIAFKKMEREKNEVIQVIIIFYVIIVKSNEAYLEGEVWLKFYNYLDVRRKTFQSII